MPRRAPGRPKQFDHNLHLTLPTDLMAAIRKARQALGHEAYTTTIRALLKRALGPQGMKLYEEPEAPLPGEAKD